MSYFVKKFFTSAGKFEYPFSGKTQNIWSISPNLKFINFLLSLLPNKRKQRDPNVRIWPAKNKNHTPLSENDFPLIFVVHNGRPLLPSFLDHYRSIGVTRFMCVDDASKDGTTDYLLKQEDVDVYFSNVRYKAAARSKTWRELLAEKYGKNRWYLNVDVDEFLFTGHNSNMTISQYAKILYKKGILRLPAPMIDMVPGRELSEAVLTDDVKPWEISSYFDLDGYHGYSKSGGIKLYGGARKRLWNADAELIKYPLIYWDKYTSMGISVHSPLPTYRNHPPVCGALLHFKIFSDVETVAKQALETGQYFEENREYKLMHRYFHTMDKDNKKLVYDRSIKFEGEETLVQNGMIRKY